MRRVRITYCLAVSLASELLGINLNIPKRRLLEKDKCQRVAGLGHYIAALARYLAVHAARVLGNDSTEAVALDGHLLARFDLVVELHQMLDDPACGGQDRERAVADKDSHVLPRTAHRPGDDTVMLEDVHRAFDEQGNHLEIQHARGADLRRKGRDAHVHERVMQDTGIYVVVEDLADGIEVD